MTQEQTRKNLQAMLEETLTNNIILQVTGWEWYQSLDGFCAFWVLAYC